jgi:RNAse (barnase) inhibitor barstar
MATFTSDPAEWQRLDWQLLQNSPVALYFSNAILADDVSWFHQYGYRVLSIQVADFVSRDALLVALGELFAFPHYFGRSLDAFNDCLSDVEVPTDGGLVLVLHDFNLYAKSSPDVAHAILDIVADNSRRFLLTGRRFVTLVHSSDPAINFEPIGATPVLWNPKEWLNSKRGL